MSENNQMRVIKDRVAPRRPSRMKSEAIVGAKNAKDARCFLSQTASSPTTVGQLEAFCILQGWKRSWKFQRHACVPGSRPWHITQPLDAGVSRLSLVGYLGCIGMTL